jgi:hypothetical protein
MLCRHTLAIMDPMAAMTFLMVAFVTSQLMVLEVGAADVTRDTSAQLGVSGRIRGTHASLLSCTRPPLLVR